MSLVLRLRLLWRGWFANTDRCNRCRHPFSEWFQWDGVRYCYLCFDKSQKDRPCRWMLCTRDLLGRIQSHGLRDTMEWFEGFEP